MKGSFGGKGFLAHMSGSIIEKSHGRSRSRNLEVEIEVETMEDPFLLKCSPCLTQFAFYTPGSLAQEQYHP